MFAFYYEIKSRGRSYLAHVWYFPLHLTHFLKSELRKIVHDVINQRLHQIALVSEKDHVFNQNKHKSARTDIWNEAEEQEDDGGNVDGNAEARADDSLVYGVGQLARHLVTQGQTTVHEEPDGRNGDHKVD